MARISYQAYVDFNLGDKLNSIDDRHIPLWATARLVALTIINQTEFSPK